jgi:rsbT co-antagonist protein RsbR
VLRDVDKMRIGAVIGEHRQDIATEWFRSVKERSRAQVTIAEIERELTPILDSVVAGTQEGVLDAMDPAYDELRAMLAEYSRTRARQGYSPSETAAAVYVLRDAVLSAIKDEDIYVEFPPFSRFIDDLGLLTFETYSKTRETVIANQTEQLLELSTPVVKLWDGVLAVPLVGTLDSARTQVVMESLLQALVSTGSAHAIIDITGVPAVDTEVAQHLLKTVFAARLMGAECVISGIRPQIAQTIVGLGIEFGDIPTKATLADAFKVTLKRAGLEIRKIQARP